MMPATPEVKERVITVEYLQPSMSSDLLCKFPDNSAFGFDYSQSGIWSPPIQRRFAPLTHYDDLNLVSRKKLGKVISGKIIKRRKKKNVVLQRDVETQDCFSSKQKWASKVLGVAKKRLKKPEQRFQGGSSASWK